MTLWNMVWHTVNVVFFLLLLFFSISHYLLAYLVIYLSIHLFILIINTTLWILHPTYLSPGTYCSLLRTPYFK